jgi:hypothetical protein
MATASQLPPAACAILLSSRFGCRSTFPQTFPTSTTSV